jgi:REP element-mobilizing transposase RayT
MKVCKKSCKKLQFPNLGAMHLDRLWGFGTLRRLLLKGLLMPRVNRREIFSETDVQVFHLISRCVRRNHLCGRDRRSGRDYSHRRTWVRDRLEELAGIFAIEVLGYALMANHMHLVIRTRPDIAAGWSDEQVARRWWALFPQRRTATGLAADPTAEELSRIQGSPVAVADKRRRLSSVSWFMKCVSEPIAKRANREDEVTGHFWEARFKAQPLLDETAIAACMSYVDLNPIRAAVAQTPETSEFTSLQDRILDRQTLAESDPSTVAAAAMVARRKGWLAGSDRTFHRSRAVR